MAQVLHDDDMVTHLRGKVGTLCGAVVYSDEIKDAPMTCKECGNIALLVISLTTKAERRAWRKL